MGFPCAECRGGVLQVERCHMNWVLLRHLWHETRLDVLDHRLLTAERWRCLLGKLVRNQLGMWRVKPVLLFNQLLVRRLRKVSVAEAKASVLRDLPAKVRLPHGVVLLTTSDLLLVDKREQFSVLALDYLSHGLVHEAGGLVQLGAILAHLPLALPGAAEGARPIALLEAIEAPGRLLWRWHLNLIGMRRLILVPWALALLLNHEVIGHLLGRLLLPNILLWLLNILVLLELGELLSVSVQEGMLLGLRIIDIDVEVLSYIFNVIILNRFPILVHLIWWEVLVLVKWEKLLVVLEEASRRVEVGVRIVQFLGRLARVANLCFAPIFVLLGSSNLHGFLGRGLTDALALHIERVLASGHPTSLILTLSVAFGV
jgi:hypothetical protein